MIQLLLKNYKSKMEKLLKLRIFTKITSLVLFGVIFVWHDAVTILNNDA